MQSNSTDEEKRRDDILSRLTERIEESNKARAQAHADLAKSEDRHSALVTEFTNAERVHFDTLCGRLDALQATVASQNVVLAGIEDEQRLLREFYQEQAERTDRAVQDRMRRSEDLIQAVGAEIVKTREANMALTTALQSLVAQIRLLGGERVDS